MITINRKYIVIHLFGLLKSIVLVASKARYHPDDLVFFLVYKNDISYLSDMQEAEVIIIQSVGLGLIL